MQASEISDSTVILESDLYMQNYMESRTVRGENKYLKQPTLEDSIVILESLVVIGAA